jgi:hypothetical protein
MWMPAILDRLPPIDWGKVAIEVGLVVLHVFVLAAIVRVTSDERKKKEITFGLAAVVYFLSAVGMVLIAYFVAPHLGQFGFLAVAAVPLLLMMSMFKLGLGQVIVVMLAFLAYLYFIGLLRAKLLAPTA